MGQKNNQTRWIWLSMQFLPFLKSGGGDEGLQGHSCEFYRTFFFIFFLWAIKYIQNNLQRIECFLLCQHVKETVWVGRRRDVDGMTGKEIGRENERKRGRWAERCLVFFSDQQLVCALRFSFPPAEERRIFKQCYPTGQPQHWTNWPLTCGRESLSARS